MKKNTVVPQLMSAEESMAWLDSKGFSYKLCDVPIPIMTGRVNCGAPLSIDDEMIEGYYYLPKSAVGLHPQVELCAQGESMIDADIHDGDLLRLELGAWPHDGDIVVAEIDGEYTAKVYFTDVGLAAHLLRIGTGDQVLRDPLVGGLFENLVVSEAMKWRCNGRHSEDFYFFRDSNGLEVDLVMESVRLLHLIEIKCAMTPNPSPERGIGRVSSVTSAMSKTIIYRGEEFPIAAGGEYVNFARLASRLDELVDRKEQTQ